MIIRELFALLGFKTDDAGAKKFDAVMGDLKTKAVGLVGTVLSVGAAVKSVQDLLAFAGATKDTADRIGINTDALQELDYAAQQGGASLESMRAGLINLGAAAAGVGVRGKAVAKILAEVGVQAKDANGRAKPTEQLFGELADALQRIPDQGKRTAVAVRVLGDAGRDLVPLLNGGADAIALLRTEARELGLVIDGQTIDAAEALGDKLDAINAVGASLSRRFAAQLVPTLTKIADGVLAWVKANRGLVDSGIDEFASYLNTALKGVALAGEYLGKVIVELVDTVGGGANAVRLLALGFLILNRSMLLAALPVLLWAAAFTALMGIIGDIGAYETHGNAVDSFVGRFKRAFYDQPFKPDDSPLIFFLKVLARLLKEVQDGVQGAAMAASDLTDVFFGSREQKLSARNRLQGFGRALLDFVDLKGPSGEDPGMELGLSEGTSVRRQFSQRSTRFVAPVTPEVPGSPFSPVVPYVPSPLMAGPTTTTDNRRYEITVSGAGDPQAVASAVAAKIRQANATQVED